MTSKHIHPMELQPLQQSIPQETRPTVDQEQVAFLVPPTSDDSDDSAKEPAETNQEDDGTISSGSTGMFPDIQ